MEIESKDEPNILKDKISATLDLQSIVTIFYISIVVTGMIFNNSKYSRFDINIFAHSDILDFLIAPLGDTKILFFTLMTLLLIFIFYRTDKFLNVKYPQIYNKMYMGKVDKPWFTTFFNAQWILLVVAYLYIASIYYSNNAKNIILDSNEKMELVFTDDSKFTGKRIGANNSFYFMLDDSLRVKIIPTSSVKYINKQRLDFK